MPSPSGDSRASALGDVHLVLFMTAGMSLAAWHENGSFEREVALYRRLRPMLRALTIVTYGDSRDLGFRDRLPGIAVVCNRWRLPGAVYRRFVGSVLPRSWRGRVLVKSNQVFGADVAMTAARTAHGAFIARCGYLPSQLTAHHDGADSPRARAHRALEASVFGAADACIVTTPAMAEVVAGHGVAKDRVRVVPNFVDTDLFRPVTTTRRADRIAFVGRLSDEKNVLTLARAMEAVPAELVLVGSGPHAAALRRLAGTGRARLRLLGNRPHAELPDILNSCSVFVLPSPHEGHPKTLLEAMACGLPVVGTDAPGIREVIRHGETGWLCGADADSIAKALRTVLSDRDLQERLGRAARQEILRTCSLDCVIGMEIDALAYALPVKGSG